MTLCLLLVTTVMRFCEELVHSRYCPEALVARGSDYSFASDSEGSVCGYVCPVGVERFYLF